MHTKIYLLILVFLAFTACSINEESKQTNFLTSKTWGKPQILHVPDNMGFWGGTSCGESYSFTKNGGYTRKEDCRDFGITGTWTWMKIGDEILIDYQNNMPYNHKMKILQLSDTLLHTLERDEHEEENSKNYWEKKYRPRKD